MKNDRRRLKAGASLIGLALALGWLTGCASPNTLDKDFGSSVQNNVAQSVLNPQAGLVDTPTAGLYPQAAASELDAYNKSFTGEKAAAQAAAPAAGGGGGGGGTSTGYSATP